MSKPFDDDLLLPELTEADDAIGFDQPWNPWSLVTLSFFFGLIAGGGLLALNFARLGMPGRRNATLAIVMVVATASILGTVWAFGIAPGGEVDRETQRYGRWLRQGIAVLAAMAIAAPQHSRFRLFQASGQPAGHLLRPAVIASVLSVLYQLALGAVIYYAVLRR